MIGYLSKSDVSILELLDLTVSVAYVMLAVDRRGVMKSFSSKINK